MIHVSPFTMLPSTSRHESVTAGPVDLGDQKEALVFLNVTAINGAPTSLDVKLQTQDPRGNWHDLVSFAQVTSVAGKQARAISKFGRYIRAIATIVGGQEETKTYTFSLHLEPMREVGPALYSTAMSLLPLADRWASTTLGNPVDLTGYEEAIVFLNCTGKTGNPTSLDVKLQVGDLAGNWADLVAFTQLAGAGSEWKALPAYGPGKLRAVATIVGGSGENMFNFGVDAWLKGK